MGFLDDAKAKLTDAVDNHGDKIADGLDKAGAVVDDKTGGKYTDKIDAGVEKAPSPRQARRQERRHHELDVAPAHPSRRRPSRPSPAPPTAAAGRPGLPTDPGNPATGRTRRRRP